MSARLSNFAPIGSLLKKSRPMRKARATVGPRQKDDNHLSAIRKLPCLCCGVEPAGVAAHVRMASSYHGKPQAGIGAKPDDCWTVPLCSGCHTDDPNSQHRVGESAFWERVDLNPILIALKLFTVSPNIESMRVVALQAIADRKQP